MKPDNPDNSPTRSSLPYVDALRGYAILLVMAVHASQFTNSLTGTAKLLLDQGARGVQLFFVASALTLLLSWKSGSNGLAAFYLRRVFRIAPMFWLGIVFFVWIEGWGGRYFAPNGISGFDVFLTAIFLHGWHPETITSVVHGGWSIAVEMTFYLVFPILVFLIKNLRSAVIALFLCEIVSSKIFHKVWGARDSFWPQINDDLIGAFLSFWFPNQLSVFIVGFILYFLIQDYSGRFSRTTLNLFFTASIIFMIVFAVEPSAHGYFKVNLYTAYALTFLLFAFCLSQGSMRVLVNPLLCQIGKVSFSAYLWHFAILAILKKYISIDGIFLYSVGNEYVHIKLIIFFLFFTSATLVCSSLTYYFVEMPAIRLGGRLIFQLGLNKARASSLSYRENISS